MQRDDVWTEELIENVGWPLRIAIRARDSETVAAINKAHPWILASGRDWTDSLWISAALKSGNAEVVCQLLDLGADINMLEKGKFSLLATAIGFDHDEVVELLLKRGADPNLDRTLIAAINRKDPERRMRYVRWLVEHGVDVNQVFTMFGDPNNRMTALDWSAHPDVTEYLKQHGAKKAKELLDGNAPSQADHAGHLENTDPKVSRAEAVIAYFASHVGPVDQREIVEVVRTGHPVSVHMIKPQGERRHLTLFTTGLSLEPMPAADAPWRWAELFIELPGDWPVDRLGDPLWNWPIVWLRKLAQYPHDRQDPFNGPLIVFPNGDPPQPLASNTQLSCLMLFAEQSFVRTDNETVQLFRVTPLYTEERELEMREGAPALFRAFDRRSVPFVVDIQRPSIVGS